MTKPDQKRMIMRNSFARHIFFLIGVVGLLAHTSSLCAQGLSNDPRFADTWKKSQTLNDKSSIDVAPIDFSIGGVNYRVPRNYIVGISNWAGGSQILVAFKVTYPNFEPLKDSTKDCMKLPPLPQPTGCMPVKFGIIGGSTAVSDDEAFHNASSQFHSQTPKAGPYGFELYETGPDNARIETYRKHANGHTLVIQCIISDVTHAVCSNHSRLPNQNVLEYILNGRSAEEQLQDAEQIDAGFRTLINSFTLTGDKK